LSKLSGGDPVTTPEIENTEIKTKMARIRNYPQGSFMWMIHQIRVMVIYCYLLMTPHSACRNLQALFLEANETVNICFHWFCANGLSLNPTKTTFIVLRPHQQQRNFTGLNLAINNDVLKRKGNDCEDKSVTFLDIFIYENHIWNYNIEYVTKRISNALFIIKQVKNTL